MRFALAFQATSGSKQQFGMSKEERGELGEMHRSGFHGFQQRGHFGGPPPGMSMPRNIGESCNIGDRVGILLSFNENKMEVSFFKNGKPIIKEPVYKKTVGMEQYSPFVAVLHGTTIKLNPNAQLPDEDDPYQIKKVDISV